MSQGRLLVVEKSAQTLGVVDLDTGRRVASVALSGSAPHEVGVSDDGRRAVVPIYGDSVVGAPGSDGSTVDVVDLVELAVRTIDLGVPSRPHDVAPAPGGRFYVTAELRRALLLLDPDSDAVRVIPTGHDQSHMVAVSSDARRAFTVGVEPGSLSVIDLAEGRLVQVLEVSDRANRIALSADGRHVFVADQSAARLAVIATDDLSLEWIDLPGVGYGTAPTADGSRLAIGFRESSQIGILDLETTRMVGLVDVPPTPQRLLIPPHGPHDLVYATCDRRDVVVEVDLRTATVTREFPVGAGPDGLAWAPTLEMRADA